MTIISEIISSARKNYPRNLAPRILGALTSAHRIQGSTGLWDAVKYVREILEENGVPTRIYRIENNMQMDLIESPVGWDLEYGVVEIYEDSRRILYASTIDHPTLVAAHSPGGEGEADIVHGSIFGKEDLGGKAVLTRDRASLAYIYGSRRNVSAIIWYSPERYHEAYPYTGLFLPSTLLKERIPVITLPYKVASRIIEGLKTGSRYRVKWSIETRYHSRGLPVLSACLGAGDESVVATAHLCHPMPGAHDNASGSTALALAAITLNNMFDENKLEYRICFYWIPEYTGTVMLFKERILKNTIAVVNYDMVASIQSITGSTLHLIRSMIYYMGVATPLMDLVLRSVLALGKTFHGQPSMGVIRFDETPYGYGSDHDVFLINGIEAVMVNEWPSKYYHTDMDEPNTIGFNELMLETQALATVLSLIANISSYKNTLTEYIRSYYESLLTWYTMEAIARGKEYRFIKQWIQSYIRQSLEKAHRFINEGIYGKPHGSIRTGNPIYQGVSNIPTLKIALELGIDFYKVVSKSDVISQFISTVLPALAKGELSIEDMIKLYLAEQLLSPSDIDVVYSGEKGLNAFRKIVERVMSWLIEKGYVTQQ